MTFDSREKSTHDGQPVECYRFSLRGDVWLITSAERPVVLPSGTYVPEVVSNHGADQAREAAQSTMEVTLPAVSPVVAGHRQQVPSGQLGLILYQAHRGEEAAAVVRFVGTIASVRFEGATAVLECAPLSAAFGRSIPRTTFQPQCVHALYGAGCGVSAGSFRDAAVLSSVVGNVIQSATFATHPDGWYSNGWVEGPDGEIRWVVAHVGDTITLVTALPGLASGQSVFAFAGCDRTEATCAAKFSNLVRHLGFPRVPFKNPHGTSVA